jgi:hypothetical protein
MRKGPECKNDIRDRGLKQQQRGSERIKNLGDRRQIYVRNKRITSMIYRTSIEPEIMKRAVGISRGLRRIRNWTAEGIETEKRRAAPLGYSRRTASRMEQCGVFAPCKNC